MPLIVDTYNVLHVTGVLPSGLAGLDLTGLADLIGESRYAAEQVCLVCDGAPRSAWKDADQDERIHVIFAGPKRSADDVIERMIDRSSSPRRLTVVSSDRRITKSARTRRCRTLRAEDFLAQLARDHRIAARRGTPFRKPRAPLSPGEVNEWIRAFGLTETDLAIGSSREPRA